jgi:hypothetical protein
MRGFGLNSTIGAPVTITKLHPLSFSKEKEKAKHIF